MIPVRSRRKTSGEKPYRRIAFKLPHEVAELEKLRHAIPATSTPSKEQAVAVAIYALELDSELREQLYSKLLEQEFQAKIIQLLQKAEYV